jgi:hypothetical protein
MEVFAAMEDDRADRSQNEGSANCSNKDQNSEAFTLQECVLERDRFFVEFTHQRSRPAESPVEVRLGTGDFSTSIRIGTFQLACRT